MTVRPTGGDADEAADGSDAQAAATRSAKASVHEAIGKLIGDDAAQRRGAAEKRAGEQQAGEQQAGEKQADEKQAGPK